MGVHLVFFLHGTTVQTTPRQLMALAFGWLIVALVVSIALLIMADLNDNMMPAADYDRKCSTEEVSQRLRVLTRQR